MLNDMDLSILIPARNEMFLAKTVEDILAHIEGKTEVLVALDGCVADPPLPKDKRVITVSFAESVGQRAATNALARLSTAKYLMKVDAHCAFDQGFDVKMMAAMKDNYTLIPTMRNLHVFDWVCKNGHRRYQSPSGPCTQCGEPTTRDIVWNPKTNPQSNAYRFDTEMHFQYWKEWENAQKGDLTETLSIQGSCFMVTRERYLALDLCSEQFSSWGQQGVEVACKTWLSGGKCMVNRKTWYAHMFRTQGGDFSFPYENPGKDVLENRRKSRELFVNNTWPLAIHPFQWLIDRFHPPGWQSEKTKGVIYYTDNRLDENIAKKCQEQLRKAFSGRIVSISLKPINFGDNIVLPLERGMLTMSKQILAGLEAINTDIVFMCEHDVLYHPSHFAFTPERPDIYYYNQNVWRLRLEDGHCLYYDQRSLSGLCAYRETLIKHYKERIRRIEALEAEAKEHNGIVKATSGNDIPLKEAIRRLGFEPGTHNRPEKIDGLQAESYVSEFPNVDIRHDKNETQNRWRMDQFRNKPTNWKEAEEIPFWGKVRI